MCKGKHEVVFLSGDFYGSIYSDMKEKDKIEGIFQSASSILEIAVEEVFNYLNDNKSGKELYIATFATQELKQMRKDIPPRFDTGLIAEIFDNAEAFPIKVVVNTRKEKNNDFFEVDNDCFLQLWWAAAKDIL